MSLTQEISELNNYQIIRKLGPCECFYDHEVIHGNLYLTRTFLVQLNQGEICLDLVKTACSLWCKRYPLLKAKIFRDNTNKYDRYFVKFEDERCFEMFKNVELIESENASKWKEVMDREVVKPFYMKTDPLWRLKVIKFINLPISEYNYGFIFTSQHTIGDGRNIFTQFIEFLNILSALLENRVCLEMKEASPCGSSVEELIKLKSFKNDGIEVEFDRVNRRSVCLGDRLNGQHGKMESFKISKQTLRRLKLKMKSSGKNCKLTGLIVGLIFLSQKNVYKKHGADFDETKCQFSILVSVRDKLGLDNKYNGVFSSDVNQLIEFDLNLNNFWEFVETQSIGLQEMIRKNCDISVFERTDEAWDKALQNEHDESSLNAIISNIGVMNNTDSDLLKVVEHYVRMPAVYGRTTSTMFNAISTIDGTLCWAISYNEKYYKKKVISELIDEINNIIEKLVL